MSHEIMTMRNISRVMTLSASDSNIAIAVIVYILKTITVFVNIPNA